MNFRNYCDTEESKKSSVGSEKNIHNNTSSNGSTNRKSAEEKYAEYSKLSKNELMQEYIKQSKIVKSKGGYSEEQLTLLRETLFPHLSDEQKAYFETLIGMVQ